MSVARVNAFNNLLRDIVNIMATKFPEDRDIEWYKSQIELSASGVSKENNHEFYAIRASIFKVYPPQG